MRTKKPFITILISLLYIAASAQITALNITPNTHSSADITTTREMVYDNLLYDNGINGLKEIPKKIIVVREAYPNPFTTSVTIPFTLYEKALVSIIVYDILGREVKTIVNEIMDAGEYKKEADLAMLQKGLYLLKVKTDEQTSTQKITCVR